MEGFYFVEIQKNMLNIFYLACFCMSGARMEGFKLNE